MKIRKGTPDDLPSVLNLVKELAVYENAPEEVENSVERMMEDGFGENRVFEFFVAEDEEKIVGLALYYYSYSTWKGKGIYLDDLIVTEAYRRKNVGRLLFDAIIRKAQEVDARRVVWQVLDWNEPAIKFYEKLNANFDKEWIPCRLTKQQIDNYKFAEKN